MYDLVVRAVMAVLLCIAIHAFFHLAEDPWWDEEEDVD